MFYELYKSWTRYRLRNLLSAETKKSIRSRKRSEVNKVASFKKTLVYKALVKELKDRARFGTSVLVVFYKPSIDQTELSKDRIWIAVPEDFELKVATAFLDHAGLLVEEKVETSSYSICEVTWESTVAYL